MCSTFDPLFFRGGGRYSRTRSSETGDKGEEGLCIYPQVSVGGEGEGPTQAQLKPNTIGKRGGRKKAKTMQKSNES